MNLRPISEKTALWLEEMLGVELTPQPLKGLPPPPAPTPPAAQPARLIKAAGLKGGEIY